ncbi:uncharacterized protein EAF02_007050 [Botrytis sinoallii]|uniref:uncharacterized protein n=1 Tax=Botrytis sinoallii TaxID=1463999 RepID=UPI0019001B25|nr:uncharacterized protein EAF02_007050 [Botrytis sinoallii]KAF7881159.1 hypothetical protein EAF02_007050 [Botrytis sinoallii]
MSIPSPPPFKPRSSSLSPHPLLPSQSHSTSHLPIQTQIQIHRKKCIYLLTTHACSHFVQPFTHPTNIIHTENCVARFGGCCSSQGYRYEILGNGGEKCEVCVRGGKLMKEKGSSGEIRLKNEERGNELEVEMQRRDRDDLPGMDLIPNTDNGLANDLGKELGSDNNAQMPSTPPFSLKKTQSSPDMYRRGSNDGKGKQMMTYEHQRAIPTQKRPMIGERKRVSIVIEEGGGYYGDTCGIFNSSLRCGREKGRKCWEDLWGRFKRL